MKAVRLAEESRGYRVVDVSAQKCGWDITSYAPTVVGTLPEPRHIEVKGRVKGASTVTVTRNEIFESWNQGVKYHLAIVLVGEDDSITPPAMAETLQKGIGGSKLVRIPQAGHLSNLENAAAFNAALIGFSTTG